MRKFFLILSFALRDVSKSRLILALIIISLSVSFAVVFLSASIFDGFKQTLENGVINSMGHLIIIPDKGTSNMPSSNNRPMKNIEKVVSGLQQIENIKSLSVRSYGAFLVSRGGLEDSDGRPPITYSALGINVSEEEKVSKIPESVIKGRFIKPSQSKEVVLGITAADHFVGSTYDKKRVEVGEEIALTSFSGNNKSDKYKIVGLIDAKTFHPNWLIYLNKDELEWLDDSKKDTEIIVALKDPEKIEGTQKAIEEKNLGIHIATWQEEAAYINDILDAVYFITNSINALLIISVFIIVSIIIFINVFQKRRQIGIIKSMGAGNKFIIAIYISETLTYLILSFLIGFQIFFLIHLYSQGHPIPLLIGDFTTNFDVRNILLPFIILFIAAIGGSIIPAYSAAKTKIVDVIRSSV